MQVCAKQGSPLVRPGCPTSTASWNMRRWGMCWPVRTGGAGWRPKRLRPLWSTAFTWSGFIGWRQCTLLKTRRRALSCASWACSMRGACARHTATGRGSMWIRSSMPFCAGSGPDPGGFMRLNELAAGVRTLSQYSTEPIN